MNRMDGQLVIGCPANYNSNYRDSNINKNINIMLDYDNYEKMMTQSSDRTSSGGNDPNQRVLSHITNEFEKLDSLVKGITCDRYEDKFLEYDFQCDKLIEQLDKLDLSHIQMKEDKKNLIQKIMDCSEKLRILSIDNLKRLLEITDKSDYTKSYDHLYQNIEKFLQNESQRANIETIDKYRHELSGIYRNLNRSTAVKF